MTICHDDEFEPVHSSSPTDHVLTELQLYGYRPSHDEPDTRSRTVRMGPAPISRSSSAHDFLPNVLTSRDNRGPIGGSNAHSRGRRTDHSYARHRDGHRR